MFNKFKVAVQKQFERMQQHDLFRAQVDKDQLWETYLGSFPEGTNPTFRERTEHDCQCCKSFIRAAGGVVAIVDGKIESIWDVEVDGFYQVVADALSALVKSQAIDNIFLHTERTAGVDQNLQHLESGDTLTWEHFFVEIPTANVVRGIDIGTRLAEARSTKDVMYRGLTEITVDALETVIELIDQNSLYRGEEKRFAVDSFLKLKKQFDKLAAGTDEDVFCWSQIKALAPSVSRIRNDVIGTLLVDISEGAELERAVKSFETKVAPTNYKRPSALITKAMIAKAQQKVQELGLAAALERRYAVTEDLTINNVLFANREAKQHMNDVFDELAAEVPQCTKKLDRVEEVNINDFIEKILPKAESIELMVENRHAGNLVSLVAPADPEAKGLFKWHNNFSWAYAGEVADSLKQRVKRAGGNVDGVLRFSIQWNDKGDNQNDFDAHCIEPNGNLISYPKKGEVQASSGMLDVDIVCPGNEVAVENITYTDPSRMQEGVHEFQVHNFSHNGGKSGFTAEIEYEGQVYTYYYPRELRDGEKVTVAEVNFTRADGIEIIKSLPSEQASKEVWGLNTQQFHKVKMVMNSPNHWDDKATGNKHYFFMLDGCANDGKARGFFNEFLTDDLRQHRKVFEVLGSKMKTAESDNQLSGLGFSSTQQNSVFCRVQGSFARTVKIAF